MLRTGNGYYVTIAIKFTLTLPAMKILIIQDEQKLARSMSVYLSEEGYRCDYAVAFGKAPEKLET